MSNTVVPIMPMDDRYPDPMTARRFYPAAPPIAVLQAKFAMESCSLKFVMSGVAGGVLGGAFGVLMGGWVGVEDVPKGFKANVKMVWKNTLSGMKFHGRTFATMGFLFSGTECIVEKVRAKHDVKNTLISGCITGGGLAIAAGPQAMGAGCVGFAAMCAAFDYLLLGGH